MLVKLYVPKAAQLAMYLDLVDEYGGVTVTEGKGIWRDDNGVVIYDPVDVYETFVTGKTFLEVETFMNSLAQIILTYSEEQSVLFAINNNPTFVPRKDQNES